MIQLGLVIKSLKENTLHTTEYSLQPADHLLQNTYSGFYMCHVASKY